MLRTKITAFRRISLLSLLFLSPSIAHATSPWVGRHEYFDMFGPPNSLMMSVVNLEIRPDGTCVTAHYGYRVFEEMDCVAKLTLDSVKIHFVRLHPDRVPYTDYRSNDVLFSIRRPMVSSELITTWGAMKPIAADLKPDEGTYFERVWQFDK